METKRVFSMIAGLAAGMRFYGIDEIEVEISSRHGNFQIRYDRDKTAYLNQEQHFFIDCLGPALVANEGQDWLRGKGAEARITFRKDLAVDLDIMFRETGRQVRERLDLQDFQALAMDTSGEQIAAAATNRALFDHPFSGNGRDYILDAAQLAVRTLRAEEGDVAIESRHLDRLARIMIEVPGIGLGGYEPDVLARSIADHLRMALALPAMAEITAEPAL